MANNENPNQGIKKNDPSRSGQQQRTPGQQDKPGQGSMEPRRGQGGRPSQDNPGEGGRSDSQADGSRGGTPVGGDSDDDENRDSE